MAANGEFDSDHEDDDAWEENGDDDAATISIHDSQPNSASGSRANTLPLDSPRDRDFEHDPPAVAPALMPPVEDLDLHALPFEPLSAEHQAMTQSDEFAMVVFGGGQPPMDLDEFNAAVNLDGTNAAHPTFPEYLGNLEHHIARVWPTQNVLQEFVRTRLVDPGAIQEFWDQVANRQVPDAWMDAQEWWVEPSDDDNDDEEEFDEEEEEENDDDLMQQEEEDPELMSAPSAPSYDGGDTSSRSLTGHSTDTSISNYGSNRSRSVQGNVGDRYPFDPDAEVDLRPLRARNAPRYVGKRRPDPDADAEGGGGGSGTKHARRQSAAFNFHHYYPFSRRTCG